MTLKKIQFKSGVNRENTRYTTEGGWYECDKVRFRQGTPQKIGGWEPVNDSTFLGTCRSLWPWTSLDYQGYLGVGTSSKYYILANSVYRDITPIRATTVLTNPFTTTAFSPVVLVTAVSHGGVTGDYVTFSGATAVSGLTLNGEYMITVLTANTYNITASLNASSPGATGGGTVTAAYQVNVGPPTETPVYGWGAGSWGSGTWGVGTSVISYDTLRIWSAANFGENLIIGPKRGGMYYWVKSGGLSARAVPLNTIVGASDVPLVQTVILVSDVSRFVLAFGANDYGSATQDPMLIRWSDQESAANWTPAATNQAGSIRLSHGSQIMGAMQSRQEILVWTDTSVYSLQYQGAPVVWSTQLLGDNTSILSDRAMTMVAGVTYWMGNDKFYMYDGRIQSLDCDLREYVFTDFNNAQSMQVCSASIEKFDEVWWFYCSLNSSTIDKYVVYNYREKVWYYGTMNRTAVLDASVLSHNPIMAYSNKLLYQEVGTDDFSTGSAVPIDAYITSSEFDIDDGHNFGFVWRVIPDIKFVGSTAPAPQAVLTLLPLQNSGSGYNNPQSVAGSSDGTIVRTATVPIEQFTGQVNIRVRGRQMALRIESTALGVAWQLGAPRLDIRPDGRR